MQGKDCACDLKTASLHYEITAVNELFSIKTAVHVKNSVGNNLGVLIDSYHGRVIREGESTRQSPISSLCAFIHVIPV